MSDFSIPKFNSTNVNTNQLRNPAEVRKTDNISVAHKPSPQKSDDTINTRTDNHRNASLQETGMVETNPETGEVTTTYKTPDGKLLKTVVKQQDGTTIETNYDSDDSIIINQTITKDGIKELTQYENNKPISKDVTRGSIQQHYEINEKGEEVLKSEIRNKGNDALEENITYSYEGDTQTTNIVRPGGEKIIQTIQNGRLVQEVKTSQGKISTTTYNENGKHEVLENTQKNITTSTNYNKDGYRLNQTQIVNGQEYKVEYDGNGNTKIVVRAGDSLEQIANYMSNQGNGSVRVADLQKLNPKLTNKNIQAGQMITVPGEYDAASGTVLSRGSQSLQKARGNTAETRLNNEISQRTQTATLVSKQSTFTDLARETLIAEGNTKPSDAQIQKLAQDIQKLNPNLKNGELKEQEVKIHVTQDNFNSLVYIHKVDNTKLSDTPQIKRLKTQGDKIAQDVYDAVHYKNSLGVPGTDKVKLEKAIDSITPDNVSYFVQAYYTKSPNEGAFEAIYDEVGITELKQKAQDKILHCLLEKAKQDGVEDSDLLKEYHALNSNKGGVGLSKNLGLDQSITEFVHSLGQGTTNYKKGEVDALYLSMSHRLTAKTEISKGQRDSLRYLSESEKENDVIYNLNSRLWNAEALYKEGKDADGWSERFGDKVMGFFGSKHTGKLTEKELKEYDNNIEKLIKAQAKGPAEFRKTFKEIYGVAYNPESIVLAEAYDVWSVALASTDNQIVQTFDKDLKKYMNSPELPQDKYNSTFKSQAADYQNFLNTTAALSFTDSKELEKMLGITIKGIPYEENSPIHPTKAEREYNESIKTAYKKVRKYAINYRNETHKDLMDTTGGLSFDAYKMNANAAFRGAFGMKNDIMAKVENYRISQQAAGNTVRNTAKATVITAVTLSTGGMGTAAAITTVGVGSAGATVLVDGSNLESTNLREEEKAQRRQQIKNDAIIDGVVGAASMGIGRSISSVVSGKIRRQAGKKVADGLLDTAGDKLKGDVASGTSLAINLGVHAIGLNGKYSQALKPIIKESMKDIAKQEENEEDNNS